MKLRLKGNSIRFRLNKTDVSKLSASGYLEEVTHFGYGVFTYAVTADETGEQLQAVLETNKIILRTPISFIANWQEHEAVGMKGSMALSDGSMLQLLIEKDFVCLDDTDEDQTDHYPNPNSICVK